MLLGSVLFAPPVHAQTIGFETSSATASGSVAVVKVVLSQPVQDTVTVQYTTEDGSAIGPTDYTTTADTLIYSNSQTISVPINSGSTGKSFTIKLSNPVNASLGIASCTITITAGLPGGGGGGGSGGGSTPTPTVQFASPTYTVAEDASTATIEVTLSGPPPADVSVMYQTGDGPSPNGAVAGTNYKSVNGTLKFSAIKMETSQSFSVPILDDGIPGPNRNVTLILTAPAGATLGDQSTSNLTIQDVDVPAKVELDFKGNVYEKQGSKAFVVNVNNFAVNSALKYTHCDNVINGDADKGRLAQLSIKKAIGFPKGGKVVLKVLDHFIARIFDDGDTARIGPPTFKNPKTNQNIIEGPNANGYEIPMGKIAAGDLTYRVECVDHGVQKIQLVMYDATGKAVAGDWVNAVLNVDRLPGDDNRITRFRVSGGRYLQDLVGVQARIQTPKIKPNYAATLRMRSTTALWVGAANADTKQVHESIQTGMLCRRKIGGEAKFAIYFEVLFAPNKPGILILKKTNNTQDDWVKDAVLKVQITDPSVGKVQAFIGDTAWEEVTHPIFKAKTLRGYSIGSELFQSMDQNPGRSQAQPCLISDAMVHVYDKTKRMTARIATDLSPKDVRIHDYTIRGFEFFNDKGCDRHSAEHPW